MTFALQMTQLPYQLMDGGDNQEEIAAEDKLALCSCRPFNYLRKLIIELI